MPNPKLIFADRHRT